MPDPPKRKYVKKAPNPAQIMRNVESEYSAAASLDQNNAVASTSSSITPLVQDGAVASTSFSVNVDLSNSLADAAYNVATSSQALSNQISDQQSKIDRRKEQGNLANRNSRRKKKTTISSLPTDQRDAETAIVRRSERIRKFNWRNLSFRQTFVEETEVIRHVVQRSSVQIHDEDVDSIVDAIQNSPADIYIQLPENIVDEIENEVSTDTVQNLLENNYDDEDVDNIVELPEDVLLDISHASNDDPIQLQNYFTQAFDCNENRFPANFLGPFNVICEYCKAYHFEGEKNHKKKFTSCCSNGEIKLPSTPPFPQDLKDLMTDKTFPHHKNFRDYVRNYNSSFAMCSMGANTVQFRGKAPYAFKVQGQVYHVTSHVKPPTGKKPQYAQLHVLDCDQANQERSSIPANENCIEAVFSSISRCLNENQLIQTYHMMREVMEREIEEAADENRPVPVICMEFKRDRLELRPDQHPGRFNAPTASNEIAMIFVDPNGEPPFNRDIRIYPKNPENSQRQFVQMNILNCNLEPMTYPLLMPYGERGWESTGS